jgi:hypothetical protein
MAAMSSRLIWRRPVAVRISAWGGYLLGLGLGDPRADRGGVSARVQTRAVAADLGIVVGDARAGGFGRGCRSSAWLTGRTADR